MTAEWTAPKTWADNELVTAALLNTHLRDNLEFLKQLADIVIIQDQKAQNTGGGTFTSGAWRTRDLNVEVHDSGNYASVSANQILLAAGTWLCIASAPARDTDNHQARLQNITDSITLLTGTSEYANDGAFGHTRSWVIGTFTLSAQKTLELQHRGLVTGTFGTAGNFTAEVYSSVILIKIS